MSARIPIWYVICRTCFSCFSTSSLMSSQIPILNIFPHHFNLWYNKKSLTLTPCRLYITPINSNNTFLCSALNCFHLEISSFSSSVNSIRFPSSQKNWDNVIWNALHIASNVGKVGALFRLNIFATVECDKFASLAKRYSVQLRSSINSRILPCISTLTPTHLCLLYCPIWGYDIRNK